MGWNTSDKSEALGISERHVLRLTNVGILPKSNDSKQITLAYVRHLKESKGGKSDLIEERIRLTRIQADRKELELKIANGELIHVDTAMNLWGQVVQLIRSKLLAFPSKIAPLVIGCTALSEIKETAEKLISEVLAEFANPDLKKYPKVHRADSLNLSNIKTTDKVKRGRMGGPQTSAKSRK